MFKLSSRSKGRLAGVKAPLVAVVNRAIEITTIDFGVSCGLRTIEEQRELVADGKSQTLKSRHLLGEAVDVFAYVRKAASYDLAHMAAIADAFRAAAAEQGVAITWGAAWHVDDIREWNGAMGDLVDSYISLRKSQGRSPFVDSPHYQLK